MRGQSPVFKPFAITAITDSCSRMYSYKEEDGIEMWEVPGG
uniref:Uncharacterized protein n=1 Tax=Anguilla anguilla TaxID=7936 RepID=A0A0E9W3X6_ANGAN